MTITIVPPTASIETYNPSFVVTDPEYVDQYSKVLANPEARFIIRSDTPMGIYTLTIVYQDMYNTVT